VVVIGGGNTAIDAAVQSRKLGAESVTLVYRRGREAMGATRVEQEFAQSEGVHMIHWAQPRRLVSTDGVLTGVEVEYTQLDEQGRLLGTGDRELLAADSVLKAIGQVLVSAPLAGEGNQVLELARGRIAVNAQFQTSLDAVWAGGDCVGGKLDLTVQAVEDGKRAAHSIDRVLRQRGVRAA
jgi:glutamate synthase (NADPH/NADH) small chain